MSIEHLKKAVYFFSADTNLINLLKFNEFSENIEFAKSPPWNERIEPGNSLCDEDIIQMKYYLSTIHNFEPNKNLILEACLIIAERKKYHPVKEYIEKEKWDGRERLNSWLIKTVGCQDNFYTRCVSKKFPIAIINRVYKPGCKFDHMLILEGDQGIGKSTMVEELAGNFYLDTSFENKDKDLVDSICNAMIVEISELSGMTKKDVDWMKSFITRKVDRIRLPYASRTKDFKRKCVFIGTYNPSGNNTYLRDDTGNRRYWPIECSNKIDIGYLKENKHQILAEAYECFKKNESYYIHELEATSILKNLHSDREYEPIEFEKIKKYLDLKPVDYVDTEELIEKALQININAKSSKEIFGLTVRIGIILKKLNWQKGSNQNRKKYYPPGNYYSKFAMQLYKQNAGGEWDD